MSQCEILEPAAKVRDGLAGSETSTSLPRRLPSSRQPFDVPNPIPLTPGSSGVPQPILPVPPLHRTAPINHSIVPAPPTGRQNWLSSDTESDPVGSTGVKESA